jgi:predicted nucleotidyltransferase
VISFLEKKYVNELVSIVLFGSMINLGEKKSIDSTDVDLLVIVKDNCSVTIFNKIKQSLPAIEGVFFSRYRKDEISLFKGFQSATGMFVNVFVCRYSDFRERKFRVFNVNRIMGKLAPQNSVWWSIQNQHKIIWGENVFRHWETFPLLTLGDLIRSFLMNWLLATGALFFFPFYSQSVKFSMEAMKWSLFTWRNYYQFSLFTPNQIIEEFGKQASILELKEFQESFSIISFDICNTHPLVFVSSEIE